MIFQELHKKAVDVITRQRRNPRKFIPLDEEEQLAIAFLAGAPYRLEMNNEGPDNSKMVMDSVGVVWTGENFTVFVGNAA